MSEHIGIRTWLQAGVSAVMLIGTVILFLLKRETSLCAVGMLDTLKKSADTNNLAMDNIAGSTESTATSIQEQADSVEKALPWLPRRSDSFLSRRRRLPITLQRSSGN